MVIWPKGELFSLLGILNTFKRPKVSVFAVSFVVIGASRCFSCLVTLNCLALWFSGIDLLDLALL